MTKDEALKIQSEQIAYYSQWVPDLATHVAAITNADALEDGEDYPVYEINRYIPRGVAIEKIVMAHSKARFSNDY